MANDFWHKYKDTRWQSRRLEVLKQHEYTCQECGATKENTLLHAHHTYYERDRDPWDYPLGAFKCLCDECHHCVHELKLEIQKTYGALTVPDMFRVLGFARGLEMQDIPPATFPIESMGVAEGISMSLESRFTPEEIIKARHKNGSIDGFVLAEMDRSRKNGSKQGS